VTLELLEGGEDSLAHLAGYLVHHRGLLPAGGDLLSTGLQSLDLRPPGGAPPEALRIRPEDPLAAAARKILARQALRLEENLEGTAGGWDDEFLHDMRVAVRRIRSALRLLAPHLGAARAASLRAELKWIGDLLGSVRDLDVFLAGLDGAAAQAGVPPPALEGLRERVRSLRQVRRTTLVKALGSARYRRALGRVHAIARPRPAPVRAMPPLSEAAPPLVDRAVTKALQTSAGLGPDPAPEALHRLRILFKRARYACEFFKEALPGPLDAFVTEAVAFQDLLGAHQDAAVAVGRVRWAAEELQAAGSLDLPGALGMGALVQVYLESARRDRRDFLTLWDSSRKGLRKLKAEIRKMGEVR
jgi:CHAD domain-containing protein